MSIYIYKQEVKQLSQEVNRLRQREQNLGAENQILKSKMMMNTNNSSSSGMRANEASEYGMLMMG